MNESIIFEENIYKSVNEETTGSDIANTDPKLNTLAKPVTPKTLPEMIGYTQPLDSPQGFVFGLTSRDKTGIPSTPEDDIVINRKLITTDIREVNISTTVEVEQDILSLFGSDFKSTYGEYISTGEVASSKIAQYFLDYGEWKLSKKVNDDFMSWISDEALDKGSATIANYEEMERILGIVGELKESLFKGTQKQGRTWIIATPKIASFLSTVSGVWRNPDNIGTRVPDSKINSYVCTIGDMDVYQYSLDSESENPETTGTIYMGMLGGPNTSSIYYMPYKRYIVRSGSNPATGQSSVIYKIRDKWSTNPQDSYDKSNSTDITDKEGTNTSKFVVKCTVNFIADLLS